MEGGVIKKIHIPSLEKKAAIKPPFFIYPRKHGTSQI
jgi:hypothetical protein